MSPQPQHWRRQAWPDRIEPLRTQLVEFARRQPGCREAAGPPYGAGSLCAAIIWAEIAVPSTGSCWRAMPGRMSRCTPPMASVGRDTCPHRAHQNCAGQRSKTAKRAIFAVERKLLRRCCYSLRKLGDASPAMPAARSRWPRRVGATASRGRASTSTNVGSSRRGGCLGAAVTPRPFTSPAQTGPELEVEIVRLCKANTRWGAHTIHAQPTRTGAPVGSGDINDSPCAATQSLIGMARPALRSTGLAALRALRAQ
jgi:hypothetical protein